MNQLARCVKSNRLNFNGETALLHEDENGGLEDQLLGCFGQDPMILTPRCKICSLQKLSSFSSLF